MSSTRSRSKQSNRNEFTRFLALESINKSRIINLQLYLGSRLYVGVIPLSCLMAKLGNGKGKCKQNVQSLPSPHAPNPMGRSKGTMRKTSQQLSTPTRLATEQTPEILANACYDKQSVTGWKRNQCQSTKKISFLEPLLQSMACRMRTLSTAAEHAL